MTRSRGPAILLVLMLGSAAILAAAELPSGRVAPFFVGLTIAPSLAEAGFQGAIPVEVREFKPLSVEETVAVSHVLPDGYEWTFKHGYGQLLPKDSKVPCRVFVLRPQPLKAAGLRAVVRGAAPGTFKLPDFKKAFEVMGLAIVGMKGRSLKTLFPVPFSAAPANLADELGLLSIGTTYPTTMEATATFKFDNVAPILGRALASRRIIYRPLDVWANPQLKDVLQATAPYKSILETQPYSGFVDEEQTYACRFLRDDDYATILKAGVEELKKGRANDLLRPKPWLGRIPGGSDDSLAIAFDVGSEASEGKPYLVSYLDACESSGVSKTDGYALPGAASANIDVLLTPLATTSYVHLQWAMLRNLMKGWRWRQILTAPNAPLTQTLVRMNEPLFDYIVLKSVNTVLEPQLTIGKQEKLDIVDIKTVDFAIRQARAKATEPKFAQKLASRAGILGASSDGFFPLTDFADHQLAKTIVAAMDGGGTWAYLMPKALAGKTAAIAGPKHAQDIVELLASGFTRPARTVDLPGALAQLPAAVGGSRGPAGATSVTLEPDLVWLERAVRPIVTGSDNAWSHPFNSFNGTRVQQAISSLVTTSSVKAMTWATPTGPVLAEDKFFFVLTRESLASLKAALLYPKTRYSEWAGKSKSLRMEKAMNDATVADKTAFWPNPAWLNSVALSTPATAGDLKTYHYKRLVAQLEQTVQELDGAVPPATTAFTEMLLIKTSPTGMTQGFVDAGPQPASVPAQKLAAALSLGGQMIDNLAGTGAVSLTRLWFYRQKVKPLFLSGDRLLTRAWQLTLIGKGLTTPAPSFEQFKALFGAVAKAAGTRLTLRRDAGDLTLPSP